jgi:hypothetical protein
MDTCHTLGPAQRGRGHTQGRQLPHIVGDGGVAQRHRCRYATYPWRLGVCGEGSMSSASKEGHTATKPQGAPERAFAMRAEMRAVWRAGKRAKGVSPGPQVRPVQRCTDCSCTDLGESALQKLHPPGPCISLG